MYCRRAAWGQGIRVSSAIRLLQVDPQMHVVATQDDRLVEPEIARPRLWKRLSTQRAAGALNRCGTILATPAHHDKVMRVNISWQHSNDVESPAPPLTQIGGVVKDIDVFTFVLGMSVDLAVGGGKT